MNKNELVEQIAERSGLSKGQASEALGATIAAIEDSLAAGQEIAITGFGKFSVAIAMRARAPTRPRASRCTSPPPRPRASRPARASRTPSRADGAPSRHGGVASCGRRRSALPSDG